MKKLLFLLLIGLSAAAQVTNAPKIPFVNIERLRTDPVAFTVRFQQNSVNMNISSLTFQCEIAERGIAFVRISLTEGSGITKTDSTVTVTLTSQQVQQLRKGGYQYRLFTVAGSAQTTRLAGNFSLWQTAPPSGSGYSSVPPVININYTASGSTNTGAYVAPPTIIAGNGITVGGGGTYTIGVNYTPLDVRYVVRLTYDTLDQATAGVMGRTTDAIVKVTSDTAANNGKYYYDADTQTLEFIFTL